MIQARSGAASDLLTSPLRRRRSPHQRGGPQEGAGEASSSRARSPSSPPIAETRGQDGHVTANAEDERRASEASTNEEIRSNSPHSLGHSSSMSVREARSSSPLPNQGVQIVSNESATSMDSVEDKSDSQSSSSTVALDEEELRRLRVQASTKSSKILPPAPSLPYDVSYSPLSPLGLDQVGTPLAALFPLETAQKAAAASELAKRTRKDAQAATGEADAGREGERPHPFAPTHHHINGKHSSHEKHKKPLPGQELEHHMVSQASDQRPLPWGLQSTLVSKARNASPGRTRMGSLKRNAAQDRRGRNGKYGRSEALASGQGPLPSGTNGVPVDEVVKDLTPVKSEPETRSVEVDDIIEVDFAALNGTQNESVIHTPHLIEAEPSPSVEPDEVPEKTLDIDNEEKIESADAHAISTSEPGPSKGKRRRGRPSRQEMEELATGNDSEALTEGPAAGDTSVESVSGSTRRPREAHKRLKMLGGYYGRQARQSNGQSSPNETIKQEDDGIDAMHDSVGATSRDASSIPEDAVVLNNIQEAVIGDAIVQTPVTPIKASQPPSLSMGLRTPVSKAQSGIMVHAGTGQTDENEGNNEFCETCNGAGHFICCDGCPRSFHFACMNPPLDIDELPSTIGDAAEKWFCNVCRTQAKVSGGALPSAKSAKSTKKRKSLFTPLLSYIETVNPTTFNLPHDVRNYFKGVATATDGSYVDSTMLRPLKIGKFGLIDERDPFRLKDKNGKLILCYQCAQSALPIPAANVPERPDRPLRLRSSPRKSTAENGQSLLPKKHSGTDDQANDKTSWRKMIGCDFCALYWHLDCLDPPLIAMPSPSRKWMCPNHIEHVVRPERVPKSTANSTSIHELPLPSAKTVGIGKHYRTRVVNEGQIDIIPDPMDTYFGSTSSSGTVAKDDGRVPSVASTVVGSSESRGKGLDKGWEEQDIPALIMSSSSKSNGSQQFKFKYRLPEKVIRLDFWQRAELEREQSRTRWIRRVEKDSRRRIDALAQVASAASAALVASSSQSGPNGIGAQESSMPLDEAKMLVETVFGSQAARTLYPVPSARQDDEQELKSDNNEGSFDSSLRHTFVTGEYEEEFDLRSKANADPDARPSFASTVKSDNSRAQTETLAGQVGVDVDEVEQLRAIKALVDRQGPQAMLAFLLSNKDKIESGRSGSNEG